MSQFVAQSNHPLAGLTMNDQSALIGGVHPHFKGNIFIKISANGHELCMLYT